MGVALLLVTIVFFVSCFVAASIGPIMVLIIDRTTRGRFSPLRFATCVLAGPLAGSAVFAFCMWLRAHGHLPKISRMPIIPFFVAIAMSVICGFAVPLLLRKQSARLNS